MAAVGVEEDPAVQAARILLSLRRRRLLRPPEWVHQASGEAPASAKVPREWPKRRRSRLQTLPGDWKSALATLKLGHVAASSRSGAWSSGENGDRSPPRGRERARPAAGDELMLPAAARQPATALYYGAPSGSGPSTSSADRAARTQPWLRHAGEMPEAELAAAAAAPPKETMSASSPETPLDFAYAAAGSNASSSGEDPARPPPKRRARGSGGASSGDEGCSSPAKRARAAGGGGKDAAEEKAISEPKMQSEPPTSKRDEGAVKFAFDLNMPWTDECSDIC